jgi:hypothetical protein
MLKTSHIPTEKRVSPSTKCRCDESGPRRTTVWTKPSNTRCRPYPRLQGIDVARQMKLGVIFHLLWSPQARISREESSRAIHMAIRLEAWICHAVCLKNRKSASCETVTCAANDFNWIAAQLERLCDTTLSPPRVISLPEGSTK